jgi:hypothetical protein
MGEHLCFSTISLGVNIVCHYQLCLAIRQGADVFFGLFGASFVYPYCELELCSHMTWVYEVISYHI